MVTVVLKYVLFTCLVVLSSFSNTAYSRSLNLTEPASDNSALVAMDDVLVEIESVLERAHELIGRPYRWGGASVRGGFDRSGLLVYLFRTELDLHVTRTTAQMLRANVPVIKRHRLRLDDFVFFNRNGQGRVGHVGLYIGDDQFIHAPRTGKNVRIDSLDNKYWRKSYMTAKRFHTQETNSPRVSAR